MENSRKEVNLINKKRGWKGARFESEKGGMVASKAFNIKVDRKYLNTDYDLEILRENRINEQGLLLVGKLRPKQPSLPEFLFRWDEKKEELDIDMHGDANNREDWISEKNGYKGHHAEKVTNGGRNFKVLIKTPKLKVFEGVISFNLTRGITAIETIRVHTGATVVFSKGYDTEPSLK